MTRFNSNSFFLMNWELNQRSHFLFSQKSGWAGSRNHLAHVKCTIKENEDQICFPRNWLEFGSKRRTGPFDTRSKKQDSRANLVGLRQSRAGLNRKNRQKRVCGNKSVSSSRLQASGARRVRRAPPLAARPGPWNGWGWRLVKLTEGSYSEERKKATWKWIPRVCQGVLTPASSVYPLLWSILPLAITTLLSKKEEMIVLRNSEVLMNFNLKL